jgi:hypothetical protein
MSTGLRRRIDRLTPRYTPPAVTPVERYGRRWVRIEHTNGAVFEVPEKETAEEWHMDVSDPAENN